MATHSSILAWKIPWTEEPGGLQSMGSQRVGHDGATEHTHECPMIYSFCCSWVSELSLGFTNADLNVLTCFWVQMCTHFFWVCSKAYPCQGMESVLPEVAVPTVVVPPPPVSLWGFCPLRSLVLVVAVGGGRVGTCYSLPFPHRAPPQAGRARAALRAFPGHLCTFSDEIIVFCPFFQLDCLFCFLLILGALFIHSEYMHMWQGFFFFTFLSVFAFTLSVVSFKK